jgi:hypothetical protein
VRVEVARGLLATADLIPTLTRPLAIVYRRDRAPAALVGQLIDYMREHDIPTPAVAPVV